jgi:anti-anti-sigma regulatory factor
MPLEKRVTGPWTLYAVAGTSPAADLLCVCSREPGPALADQIVVLGVAGEVDPCGRALLRAALTGALAGRPGHLVVDLSGMTFCDVVGFMIIAGAAVEAAVDGIGYAVSGLSPDQIRYAELLWGNHPPVRYDTVAAAVRAIRAERATQPG